MKFKCPECGNDLIKEGSKMGREHIDHYYICTKCTYSVHRIDGVWKYCMGKPPVVIWDD